MRDSSKEARECLKAVGEREIVDFFSYTRTETCPQPNKYHSVFYLALLFVSCLDILVGWGGGRK